MGACCMDGRDLNFGLTFVVVIGLLIFFLDASFTGLVPGSMHCDDGGCTSFCSSDTDCLEGVCCAEKDYGVCTLEHDCHVRYSLALEREVDVLGMAPLRTESPARTSGPSTYLYEALLLVALLLGVLYVHSRAAGSKRPKKLVADKSLKLG